MFTFSLLSLPFIGQMPVLADENLGIAARSTQYGILYACFGVGALIGALSIGTVLAGRRLERVVRVGLVVFAGFLTVFALLRVPAHAYLGIVLVGVFYFAVITSLSTVLQFRLDDSNRGRVMAIWIMCFGGTVPIGNLIAGPLIEATSITAVVLCGAVVAVALAVYADLEAPAELADELDRLRRLTVRRASSEAFGEPLEAGDAAALDQDGVAVAEVAERGQRPRRSIATSSPP